MPQDRPQLQRLPWALQNLPGSTAMSVLGSPRVQGKPRDPGPDLRCGVPLEVLRHTGGNLKSCCIGACSA